jgi:hypothetical protein
MVCGIRAIVQTPGPAENRRSAQTGVGAFLRLSDGDYAVRDSDSSDSSISASIGLTR